ncbi:MAG: MBL fold metallo-hydrolase [Bacteroidetes bacterium]|nr:MAG: MBL fold metallo-hydrolase [Bacteroidota bacterium]
MKSEDSPRVLVQFLGASGTVTGSKYLIHVDDHKILVDCGLFQGLKKLRLLNWEGIPTPIHEIDYVLLTHGHLDHCGYLPRLVKKGYDKTILGTEPTLDIAAIVLRDSAKIQEETARKANAEQFTIHSPAEPLYSVKDAEHTIEKFRPVEEGEWKDLFNGVSVRFQHVGHIIGASFIELDIHGKRYVFSGDVGRKNDWLLTDPKKPKRADVLFVESTYGDRIHPTDDPLLILQTHIQKTLERKGTVIIPCFAVERAQTIMYLLWKLKSSGQIMDVPMVMDSPMGGNVLDVFGRLVDSHVLKPDEFAQMKESFWIVQDIRETKLIVASNEPKIIVAGSGMLSGGRVLTYLERYLAKKETTIILSGFQAAGTRGRALLDGAKNLKIYGNYYPTRAEVYNMEVLSSHADQDELLDWLNEIESTPERVFIVHGEPQAADTFRRVLKDTYQWNAEIPELYQIVQL